MKRKPNLLILGIDSLSARNMSCYGYPKLTTPYMDRFAAGGAIFENTFSPHIPTTPGYACMLTGMDCFNTQIVALRHKGGLRSEVRTLPEILKENGYNTTSVQYGFRGFEKVLEYSGWGGDPGGKMPKAENLNKVALPELERLADAEEPFFLFLRHLDPHTPYLPPAPYERMFYHGNELDPANKSMDPVYNFKPFCDYFASWLPGAVTDKDYVIAQYDGAVAYMDAAIQSIFTALETRGILDDTVVVITADHGETLYDHECWFDHHGTYDNVLHVPLIIRYPSKVPAGLRLSGYNQNWDIAPTILDLMGIKAKGVKFDGRSLMDMVRGEVTQHDSEFYFTECTWMHKHGWRTPQWKLIVALEPDFHFKPPVELYNMLADPDENNNLAEKEPEVVAFLKARMEAHIAKREKESGLPDPIFDQGDWHGHEGVGSFKTSQQAYDTLHIGNPGEAAKLQAQKKE